MGEIVCKYSAKFSTTFLQLLHQSPLSVTSVIWMTLDDEGGNISSGVCENAFVMEMRKIVGNG